MRITARGLNRSTLGRQLLLEREPLGVGDAVRRVVALQAQQPASPYLTLWNRLADFDPADLDAAFAGREVVKRYLEGFGPASVADVAQFALVQRARARKALQALAGDLERLEGPNGEDLFDIPGALRPDEGTPAPPRLMAMWDSILLAYSVRSRVIPPDYRTLVIRSNGDVLPTLLVDGYVAGVWRSVEGGIEATAFHRLPDEAWERLAAEARSLVMFLADREPEVYRRYDHWWSKLPSAEARLLPGD